VLPNHLADILTNTNSIHNHNTRNSEFKPKTNNNKKAFAYRGAKAWNNLSAAINHQKVSLALKPK
jgi:hypothetical protein